MIGFLRRGGGFIDGEIRFGQLQVQQVLPAGQMERAGFRQQPPALFKQSAHRVGVFEVLGPVAGADVFGDQALLMEEAKSMRVGV